LEKDSVIILFLTTTYQLQQLEHLTNVIVPDILESLRGDTRIRAVGSDNLPLVGYHIGSLPSNSRRKFPETANLIAKYNQ
jgi:hypothetical protein